MSKSFASLVAVALVAVPSVWATGIFAPNRWLEFGGIAASVAPEFMWDVELRRIARPFTPPEKLVLPDQDWFYPPAEGAKPVLAADEPKPAPEEKQSDFLARLMDHRDFAEALKQGKVKAIDPKKALETNDAARQAVDSANEGNVPVLPEEEPSEFADYHRAAALYRQGVKHWDESAKLLQALLARPKEERQYRSVWASYMLGKIALYQEKDDAPKWFQMTRALAKEGFKDSIGLAADSYGWEAQHEFKHQNREQAAKLYLTQLALGDPSAYVSLKALIPDRPAIDGMMNFGNLEQAPGDPAELVQWQKAQEQKNTPELFRNARDPLLCQLQSAHVLATETTGIGGWWEHTSTPGDRCKLWLKVAEKAGVKTVADAGRLGWVAYAAGDYEQARRWLKLSPEADEISLWLQAKLARRDGDLKQAASLMTRALESIRNTTDVYGEEDEREYFDHSMGFQFDQAAYGELGSLQLSRGEFAASLSAFMDGHLWPDACYVAEYVLTSDELIAWMKEHPSDTTKADGESRSLVPVLARRLVREDLYAEAREFFMEDMQKALDDYTAALKKGANEKLPKKERARAWFDAAVIARSWGMELMGTEFEPDGTNSDGSFEPTNVAGEREAGKFERITWENVKKGDGTSEMQEVKRTASPAVTVSAEEKKRLLKHKPVPYKRYHYRYVAAALGWKAAALLPDQSEELADVLNTAGGWIKGDDKAADKYFQAIERRAYKTELGKEAGKAHWFVEHYGPWSAEPKE